MEILAEVPISSLEFCHPLAKEYLSNPESVATYFSFAPDMKGAEEAILKRKDFTVNRTLLHTRISSWYQQTDKAFFDNKANAKVKHNLDLLLKENAFTITTGHQLCLFTGPEFFIYKILSAVKYCCLLKDKLSAYDFVPVYWMASEDHDLEEIKSINLFGKTLSWQTEQSGAVGRMTTSSLKEMCEEVSALFANQPAFEKLKIIFEKAYLGHENLAAATTVLVNELFREFGVLVIQADDAALKKEFTDIFKKDIFTPEISDAVKQSTHALKAYSPPVNARDINVFYLQENKRSRIIKHEETFTAGDAVWTQKSLEEEIENHPECFSPNVILRPMYQEKILPNICYIGGTNELSYCLQLKKAFEVTDTFFPQFIIRDSAVLLSKDFIKQWEKLKMHPQDLLLPYEELEKKYYLNNELMHPAEQTIEDILRQLEKLNADIQGLDKTTVIPIVRQIKESTAELKDTLKTLKAYRQQRAEDSVIKLKKLYGKIYPDGSFQERYNSFIPDYVNGDGEFFSQLAETFNPMNATLKIFSF